MFMTAAKRSQRILPVFCRDIQAHSMQQLLTQELRAPSFRETVLEELLPRQTVTLCVVIFIIQMVQASGFAKTELENSTTF
jgi:hypothetical protein